MKIGVYGLIGSGRKTVFQALQQGLKADDGGRKRSNMTVVLAPDSRLDPLTEMFKPKKTTPARITFSLPDETQGAAQQLADLAGADGLLFVVRNFDDGSGQVDPVGDLRRLDDELVLRDLGVVEGRLERLPLMKRKGQSVDPAEEPLLNRAKDLLEQGLPLRTDDEISQADCLRSYSLMSAKPRLVAVNNEEGEDGLPDWPEGLLDSRDQVLAYQASLEAELAQLGPEEAAEFRAEYGMDEPGLNRMVRACYRLMGLISFFTVGEDEVRAWTIPEGADAVVAAGAIHSDLAKGFIRAEVTAYDDLMATGSLQEAKNKGLLRLEGKDYIVKDGDILTIRFNV